MLLVIAKLSPVPGVFPLTPPPLGRDYHEPPIQVWSQRHRGPLPRLSNHQMTA